ncbi:MAG: GerAB/ArcD/ProY family transporter, partial [Bacillota bacterium]|nr:GerAB/ArcD/ProY family transporter [Bacillota bacterium]
MNQEDLLTPRQFFLITFFFIMGSAILFIPSIMAATAKNDAWLATILGVILGLVLNWFYYKMYLPFQGKNLVEIFDDTFGKWIGKFCTINLIIFLIYLNSMIIRGIGDFLSTQFLKETPMEVSILLLICIV